MTPAEWVVGCFYYAGIALVFLIAALVADFLPKGHRDD